MINKKKTFIIAEAGVNHNGSYNLAKKLVDAAKRSGVEIIKHQTHIIDDEMSETAKKYSCNNTNRFIALV